ncbi:hypothetical protein HK099_007509, partial [Clydaea vesicula]
SVKDRLAIAVIEDAERKGLLKPGQTVIEATSGNTGIALAMVCAVKGYPFVSVMSESFSVERRKLMKYLGAKVIVTAKELKGTGMVEKAESLAKEKGWFLTKQFENPANPEYHSQTTGPEIVQDFVGKRLDYFVSGFGTGGTITGVSSVLKVARPEVKIIACEPESSKLLTGHEWSPHAVQGWSPNFVPKNLNTKCYDDLIYISDKDALETSRELAKKEGLFVGVSAGASVFAALQVAKNSPPGTTILTVLPDTAERYLSTPLFDGISVDSD